MPTSSGSFVNRQLRVTFTLNGNNASFRGSGNNVLQLTGLRMQLISKGAGYPAFVEATLKVFGMSQQDMNALAVVLVDNAKTGYLPNTMLVEANSGNGWQAAFSGNILTAGPDYSQQPDVCLVATSMFGAYDLLSPSTPTSFPGTANIADIASVVVSKMGYKFLNNGVTGTISGTYLAGTLMDQLKTLCQHANIDFTPDGTATGITITPKGTPISVEPWVLTPQSGLVANPQPQANGYVAVRSIYNPQFYVKTPITIAGSSSVIDTNGGDTVNLNSTANGNWWVTAITNTLEALTPNGAWFSDMLLVPTQDTQVTPT